MRKALKRRQNRGQKNLQVYGCVCECSSCGGCGSVPSTDIYNVERGQKNNNVDADFKLHNKS